MKSNLGVLNLWAMLVRALDSLQPPAALLARLYIAQVFFLSGLTRIRDWGTTVALFSDDYKVPFLPPALTVAVISLSEIVPAAFQQLVFWGFLPAGLAIYGLGPLSWIDFSNPP